MSEKINLFPFLFSWQESRPDPGLLTPGFFFDPGPLSLAKTIVFAWVNDDQTLRAAGSKSDPYATFEKMLERGNPPDDWDSLVAVSQSDWSTG